MSIEDILNSEVVKQTDKLAEILQNEVIDWELFEQELSRLPNINAIDDGDTILTELYHVCPDGSVLIEVIKRFLRHGYDLSANGGLNGSQCLHDLCWATYGKYILDAAKLLLAEGASPSLPFCGSPEEGGLENSISWRLSSWVTGYFTIANIFEAYWNLVKAFREGKDYSRICAFEDCIGEPLLRAEFVPKASDALLRQRVPLTVFDGSLILWFGEKPLVVSPYIDFVIDPVFAEEHRNGAVEQGEAFTLLLNATLTEFVFMDACTAQLRFDNGKMLLISSAEAREDDYRYGFFEIRDDVKQPNLCSKQIKRILINSNKVYSSTGNTFKEHTVALLCGNEAFLVHGYPEPYAESRGIRIVACSPQFVEDFGREIDLPTMQFDKTYIHREKLVGIRMQCGEAYFYLFADDYVEINLKLAKEKISSWEELSQNCESEKLKFYYYMPKDKRFKA